MDLGKHERRIIVEPEKAPAKAPVEPAPAPKKKEPVKTG